MCHKQTILARDDAAHIIAQCEHGTIHVFWMRAAIFLHPDDLVSLLVLLQCWQPSHDLTASDGFTIARQASGELHVWCNEAGLRMSEAELCGLVQLLWQAAGRLDLLTSDRQASTQHGFALYRRLSRVPEQPEYQN